MQVWSGTREDALAVWRPRTEDARQAPAGTSGPSTQLILQSKGDDMATEVRSAGSAEGPNLLRELHLWEAVGISLALMAPSMAANINPQGTATTIGRAVPLAF